MITRYDRIVGKLPKRRVVGRTTRGTLHLLVPGGSIYRGGPITTLGGYPFAVPACDKYGEVVLPPATERPGPPTDSETDGDQVTRAWWTAFDELVSPGRACKRCSIRVGGKPLDSLPFATFAI